MADLVRRVARSAETFGRLIAWTLSSKALIVSTTMLALVISTVSMPTAHATSLVNPSFEIPALSSYQYNPTGTGIGWTFSSQSGIQHNGSAWNAATAPDGVQTAFVQRTGSISQALNLTAGSYALSFKAAQRSGQIQPVQVTVDGTQIGSLVSPASGSFATFSIPFSVAVTGAHTITLTGTDPNDKTTFVDAVTLTSNSLVATTTTLASSLNPSTAGTSVIFTTTVTGSAPAGNVAFTADGTTLTGCGAVALPSGTANSKTASCSSASLAAGSHSIVATYGGDGSNSGSTSATLSQVVNKATSTTTLSSSVNPSAGGASVTFTASVTGFSPTGTVAFTADGATLSGCGAVALPTGSANSKTATCSTTSLATGTRSIVATYAGDAANSDSTSTALSQVVNSAALPSALVNPSFEMPVLPSGGYQYNPTAAGIGWTFSSNSGIQRNGSPWGAAAAPDGVQTAFIQGASTISQALSLNAGSYTLTFKVAQRSGQLQPIRVSVDGTQVGSLVSPASISFALVSLPFSVASTGTHTLTFSGTDASGDKSTFIDAVTLSSGSVVATTTTTLASSLNPSTVGSNVTFTATVNGSAPTGSVNFTADGTTLTGCAAVALPTGSSSTKTATCSTASLAAGTHSVVATYAGDAANSGSTSTTLSQQVKTVSTTSLASSLNPSTVGTNVIFTATVTGSAPTGNLSFTADGTALSGCGAVALPTGSANAKSATCGTTSLAAGSRSVGVTYAGDAVNSGSTSTALSQVVNATGTGASQTITFPPLVKQLVGVPSALSATASSGLAVTFASLTTATCTVSGSTLSPVAAGTCIVQASQPGNVSYAAAPSVNQSALVIAGAAFAPQVTYPVGTNPQGVAVGDFNGDGKLDLAVSNVDGFTVSVFLGNGDGTFTLVTTVPTDVYPEPIAVGDFNGDGRPDLVVGNTWSRTLSLYLGNGNGTFGARRTIAVNGAPYGVAVADLNHDGKLDLIVTDGSSTSVPGQTIEVLLGKGDGTFQAPVLYTVGANPQAIETGDFNSDGYLDLAVANYDGNSVSILLGRGDGTFRAASSVAAHQGARSLVVADFNGDGKLDLATANDVSGDISILLGRGDGTFGPATNIWTGSPATFLAVVDLNGDGTPDLAVTQVWTDNLGVLLGVGDGSFRAASTFLTGVSPLGVAIGDFNRDGKNDIVVVNHQSNSISVLLNTAAFMPVATLSVQAGTPQSAAINTVYATPFTVLALDSSNNPVAGAIVTFTAPATGASGTFASGGNVAKAFTGPSGLASAPTFTANGLSGSFSMVATAGARSAPFALTNTGGGAQAPTFTNGTPPNGFVNAPYGFTLTANGTPAPSFSVTANALPTGLALSGTSGVISGTPNTIGTFAGMFTAGNAVLPNATQTFAITISGVAQTITFGAPGNKAWGTSPFALSATASSGLAVIFTSLTTPVCTVSGFTVTIANVGTCTIQATQAGNATYAPATSVTQSFTITPSSQTIAFGLLANQPLGNPPFWLSATASSGLVVYLTSLTTSVCTVSGNTVTLATTGTCAIRASQPGSTYYTAALSVDQSFMVTTNQPPTVSLTAPADKSSYIAPVTVSLTAAPSDSDGTVIKIEFYDGGNLIGSATGAPYSFAWTNVPVGTHTLTAKATDNLGGTGTSPAITIAVANLALALTPALGLSILSPTAGSNLTTDLVHVRGTYSGPPNTGITVNGVVACTDGANFFADNIDLVSGANTLTVTATTLDGRSLTQTLNVTSAAQASIQVSAEPPCGPAPLNVTFEVTSRSGAPLTRVTIDFDGNGTIDYNSASVTTPVSFFYRTPGTYQTQLTVTDPQGNNYSETRAIVVQDSAAKDQLFKQLWSGMHDALLNGDKATALRYLNGPAQAKYDPVFTVLLPDMPAIVASYTSFQQFAFGNGITEYALNRTIDGVDRLFLINFMQDDDGVWRFDSM